MKILILILVINSSVLFSQGKECLITFIVHTPLLDDSSLVFITGNHKKLGEWSPSLVPLIKTSDRWTIAFSFQPGENLEYKFTKGSWNSEAVDKEGNVPGNNHLRVVNDTTLFYTIGSWKNDFNSGINGQITGEVKYHYNFQCTGLSSRDIIVWLPPGYDADASKRYPVLYAHDGQNVFDPLTSSFGYDWQMDEKADSLIKKGLIEPVIIVGIYNTPARSAEYGDTDTGKAYMNFIVNELKPFIDKNYRTKPDRDNTAVIGSSSGGLISFRLVWEHTDIFSKAACVSPAFHIDDINYLPVVEDHKGFKDIKIYIDNGGVGLEEQLQPGINEMLTLLYTKGYKEKVLWYKDNNAEHNEQAWSRRIALPLQFMFGKKQ